MRSIGFRLALAALALGGVSFTGGGLLRADPVSLDKKMVWAHAMIVFPLDLDVLKPWAKGFEQLYPRYPLDVRRNYPHGHWCLADVRSAKAAGVDGFDVDIFHNGASADAYMTAADELGGFQIAACLDLSMKGDAAEKEAAAIKAIGDYCDSAAPHRCAARVGDAFLIVTYGSTGLPPESWRRVRDALTQKGHKTFWVADLDIGATGHQPTFPAEKIAGYFPVFEGGYFFTGAGKYWNEAVELFKSHGKFFAGGMWPSYCRVGGGYQDARATAAYRELWARQMESPVAWATIVTWNDLSENTEIMPDSDWNLTRSEITRWMAARWKGQAPPWNEPRLYLTAPQMFYPEANAPVEALVLNGSDKPVAATLEILDPNGRPMGLEASDQVAAGADGTATVNLTLGEIPPRRFLRARATLRAGKETVATVVSAPILLADSQAQVGIRTLYYSVPARQALAGTVKLTLDGTPIGGKTAQAKVIPPAGVAPLFSEVLFNGEILKNYLTEPPAALAVPVHVDRATVTPDGANVIPVGAIKGQTEWGFYLARVTDAQYRVGYSDPVYVAPAGDLGVKEHYDFDEGAGKTAADTSAFHRSGELQNVRWVTPGCTGKGACVSFNGKDSRLNLSVGGTPSGPFSLTLAVRPRAYAGMLYADDGGLWMAFTPDGKALYTRLRPGGGWNVAHGKTVIPLNKWTLLEFTWDGKKSCIFVNGQLDGAADAPPAGKSGRRALGCNPFGHGSSFYDGDLDNLEIKALGH